MRIIPKKIKVKNTVWKCYSMPDVIVALVMFALIFAFITTGNWVLAVIFGIVSVVMFMPTQDGIFYACILENVRFLFSKKKYISDYYIVLYGRNELDLENAAVNVSSEVNKCGLNTKLLDKREIELINNLVVETYERKGITETTDCSNFKAEDFPLFSDLLETLQAKNKESMDSLT